MKPFRHVTFTTGKGLPGFGSLEGFGSSPMILGLLKAGFLGYVATRDALPAWARGAAAIAGLVSLIQGWTDSSMSGIVAGDLRGYENTPCNSCTEDRMLQ